MTAVKNVALSEDVFMDHFMGRPVMPGALQIEALAQAGSVLLEASSGLTTKAFLIMVNMAKFREIVKPGDQLFVESEIESYESNVAKIKGTIHVGDRIVTTANLTFSEKPFSDVYDPRLRPYIEMLYAILLDGAKLVNINLPGGPQPSNAE